MLTEAGHEAVAVEGAKSQYDVVADGALVFSKQHEGRFPEDDEMLRWAAALLHARLLTHLGSGRWRSSGHTS